MNWRAFALLVITTILMSCGITRNATIPQISHNNIYRVHPRLNSGGLDSLTELYGSNKIFCDQFLEPTLIALSYYPELRDVEIEFRYSNEATTMAARPAPISMFWQRKYLVLINNSDQFSGIHLKDVSFNAQIGIIGHELAHIADYENRNFIGVMGVLLRYSSKSRKPMFEQEIDKATIERGLGWQLYDWARFSMELNTIATEEYKAFKQEHYLEPHEIEELIYLLSRYGCTETEH